MNLPSIDLPQIPIPFEIPHMLHPCIVHFAVALPFVVLFLEIINLFVKKRTVGVVAFIFSLMASATIVASYMTGNIDASLTTSIEAIEVHKTLGAYLVIISLVVVVFKLFSVMIRTGIVRAIYLMILMLFVALIVKEAIGGKELVYKKGINIDIVMSLQKELKDTTSKLSSLTKEIEILKANSIKDKVEDKVDVNTTQTHKDVEQSAKELETNLKNSINDVNIEDNITDINITDVKKDLNSTKL